MRRSSAMRKSKANPSPVPKAANNSETAAAVTAPAKMAAQGYGRDRGDISGPLDGGHRDSRMNCHVLSLQRQSSASRTVSRNRSTQNAREECRRPMIATSQLDRGTAQSGSQQSPRRYARYLASRSLAGTKLATLRATTRSRDESADPRSGRGHLRGRHERVCRASCPRAPDHRQRRFPRSGRPCARQYPDGRRPPGATPSPYEAILNGLDVASVRALSGDEALAETAAARDVRGILAST